MATGHNTKSISRGNGKRRGRTSHSHNINLGVIVFGLILIYLIYSVIRYATQKQVVPYLVREGSLQENQVYSGICLRTEEVVNTDTAGYVNYYYKEKNRLGTGDLACTIDSSGTITDVIESEETEGTLFDTDDYASLQADIESFTSNFSASKFDDVYDFKDSMDSSLQKITNAQVLTSIDALESTSSLTKLLTENTGYIVYSTDGYEDKTFDALTASDFSSANYDSQVTERNNNDLVAEGDFVYKLETAEDWSVAIQLGSEEEANALQEYLDANGSVVEVQFLKTQQTLYATVTIRNDADGNYFANLAFTNSMLIYCTDRFVDVKLLTDETTGLKIPVSALVDGEFYTVPADYITTGTDGQLQVTIQTVNENGDQTTITQDVDPYGTGTEKDEDGNDIEGSEFYYISEDDLESGTVLVSSDGTSTYTVGDTASLTGVYNINEGYADFTEVTVIKQNDEYAIVEPNDTYGLREYDYIVLDASTMTPGEFVVSY